MTASDNAAESAESAADATATLATLQTGKDANADEMGGNEAAMAAQAAADDAAEAASDAADAAAEAEAATTGADAEAALRMALNAQDAAEAAEATAAEMAEAAIEAAKMELHIDGTMKWVDIVDDDGNVTGMSSVDASTGMLTRGTAGVDLSITGLLRGMEPSRSTAASDGQHFIQGTGVDGKTGEVAYKQAKEAGSVEIGKVLDTSDDAHRLMLITSHQRDKTVRVFVDREDTRVNAADGATAVLNPNIAVTIDTVTYNVSTLLDGATATSIGMYYEATDRIEANDAFPVVPDVVGTPATTANQLDAYDRVKVNDADAEGNPGEGAPAKGVEIFEITGINNAAGNPVVAYARLERTTETPTDVMATPFYQLVDIIADASMTDGGDANLTADDLHPVTADIAVAADYKHIHFGVWAGLDEANKRTGAQDLAELGIGFVQNIEGGVTEGSITGTATFRGDWAASVRRKYASDGEKGAIKLDDGQAMLTANFSEDEFTGLLTGLATLEGSLSGNEFMGTSASKITHPDLEATGTFEGSFSGAIYGAEGAEAGGVFSFDGDEAGAFVGAFGGRDVDQPVKD